MHLCLGLSWPFPSGYYDIVRWKKSERPNVGMIFAYLSRITMPEYSMNNISWNNYTTTGAYECILQCEYNYEGMSDAIRNSLIKNF